MDVENIFRDVKLSKTEMTVLRFIQNDPEQCIRQGVRAVAEQCYSNPSSLVRLAKKLKFSGWLELVYFIKFNITMPKLDVTNDIDYMSIQPAEALTPLLASLAQQRVLIHGSGFSIPVFWLALLLTLFFSLTLGWLPVSGRFDLLYEVKNVTGFALIDAWLSDSPWRPALSSAAGPA